MENLFEQLRRGLIVSCQAEGDDPFNTPGGVALFARAAVMGGAAAIRSEGIAKIRAIRNVVPAPLIGLVKSEFADGRVCITRKLADVAQLVQSGCDIIAIDGTGRLYDDCSGPDFIRAVRAQFEIPIMADISTAAEAEAAIAAGADCVSTTLSGYTAETESRAGSGPDEELVRTLVQSVSVPVFAEGRINTPEEAQRMLHAGAWAVVVGSAITRPRVITGWYREAMDQV